MQSSSEPSSPIDPSQRYQRLANFLLAVVLRLEGVKRPSSTPTATCTPDDIKQQDRPTRQEPWSPVISPVSSNSTVSPTYTTPVTSEKESSDIIQKSQSSDFAASYYGQSEATDTSLTPKTKLSTPQRPVTSEEKAPETPSVACKDSESSHQSDDKFGSCPCTIFYTPDTNFNPRMFLEAAGGKFAGKCGASTSPSTEYYSTPNPTFPNRNSCEIVNGKDAAGDLGDWKQMKDFFLSEASNLYLDAMRITHSARLVEGVIYHSVAEMVVKDVLKNVRQKMSEEKFADGLSTVNHHNEASKLQKQQVQFKVPKHHTSRQREFVAPRQCTPFRPAPPAPQKVSALVSRITSNDYDDDHENSEELMDVYKQLKFTASSSELGRSNTGNTPPRRHSSFTRLYPESPPVPFKLRTTNPVCNSLLRKMVEKHFSGENATEKDENDDVDESITETGDAKTETSLEVETRKTTKFLSATTQTERKDEIDKTSALIQRERPEIEVKGKDTMSVDREIQTDGPCDKEFYDAEDRRICEALNQQPSTPLQGDATEKQTESVDDLKNVTTCAKDIMTGSGDYRRQAGTIVMTAIYRAVSKMYVDNLMREIGDKLGNDSSMGTFDGAVFDRNTPNVPDSAKESLNIVSRTSSSDDLFQWSSSAFERAAASLIGSTPQSEFKWTPYRRDMSGPNRASGVTHHPQFDSRHSTKVHRDEETALADQEVYLSAESGNTTDDEFEDARSQNSDAQQLQNDDEKELVAAETRDASLIDDSTLNVVAADYIKFIIRTSLTKIAEDEARNRFARRTKSEDRDVEWSDVIVVSETSSATQHDHTYIKPDIGGSRDSATTIETVSDSQGESGFSDAHTSVSDFFKTEEEEILKDIADPLTRRAVSDLFNTEEEDMEAIKAIVDPFMRRAVDVVVDGVKDDWSEFLEETEREAAKLDDLSESESGISAASSYHSITSDLTDVTLVLSEVEQNASTRTAGVHTPQLVAADENASEELCIRGVEPEKSDNEHDLTIPISFLKEQMTGVKALVAKFQEVDDTSMTTPEHNVQEKPTGNQEEPAINEQRPRDTTSCSNTTCDQPQSLNWIRIASQSQSGTTTYSEPRSVNSVLVARTPSIISDVTTRSSQHSGSVKTDETSVVDSSNTVSASASSESRNSRLSLKREAEMSRTESSGVRKRPRPRVKTHVFFWEKLSDRKKVKKIREKPINPVTPAKETIHKFEQIARKSSSSSMEFIQRLPKHEKKPGMRRRIGERLRLATTSKTKHQTSFWKNKAFFTALETPHGNDYSSSSDHGSVNGTCEQEDTEIKVQVGLDTDDRIHDVTDSCQGSSENEQVLESQIQIDSEVRMTSDRDEDTEQQFKEHEYQIADDRFDTGAAHDQENTDNLEDEHGYESANSRIEALIKPSKSEEEIQAWMAKRQMIKQRTALLLNKCVEGENQYDDGNTDKGANKDTTDIASLTSVSSHDTGIRIFPFGVPITGDQVEMFNPDQHIAALEQDSDWVASSDDNVSRQTEAALKESSETLKETAGIKSRDIIEGDDYGVQTGDTIRDDEMKATKQESTMSQLTSEEKLQVAESSETCTSYYDAETPSGQTSTEQGSFYSAVDIQDTHEIREPKTQPALKAEQLLIAKPLPKKQSLSPKTQPLLRAKPLLETQPATQMEPLPKTAVIKKKKKEKGFKLFKIFKSKKGRKMANKRVSTESAASGETSDGTIHVHSPSELDLGSASWSTHAHLTSNKGRRDHNVMNKPTMPSSNRTDHALHVHSPSELESDSWSQVNLPSKKDKVSSRDTTIEVPHVHTPSELQTDSWSHVNLPSKRDKESASYIATDALHAHAPSKLQTDSRSHEDRLSKTDNGNTIDAVHVHSPSEMQTDSWSYVNLPSKNDKESSRSTATEVVHVYSPSELNLGTDSWSHVNLPSGSSKDTSSTTGIDAPHMHSPSELQSDSWSHVNLPSDRNQKSSATASDAIHMHSPSELQSDSWSTHMNTPSDGGNRSDSWEISGITSLNSHPAITSTSPSEVSTTDSSSVISDKDKAGKRSLRKRLFHFGGLRKSGKSKSSRHPVGTK